MVVSGGVDAEGVRWGVVVGEGKDGVGELPTHRTPKLLLEEHL